MGGKKKKSAAAPTSVTPGAAVNATESSGRKQQQRPNNDKSTSKENKPRGQTSFKNGNSDVLFNVIISNVRFLCIIFASLTSWQFVWKCL